MDNSWIYQLTILLILGISEKLVDSKQCNGDIWDNASEGRFIWKVDVSCDKGRVFWHGPYGGLYVRIEGHGPNTSYQLCLQAYTLHSDAVIYVKKESSMDLLLRFNSTDDTKYNPSKSSACISARGPVVLFAEANIGAPVSSKVIIDYDLETNPRYGNDVCRPCTDEELLWNYCTSDFVAIGRMLDVQHHTADTVIPVSIDYVKQQSEKVFAKTKQSGGKYYGELYAPAKCGMQYGKGKFVFMGKHKFGKAHLRCAPTYEDYEHLQRTSKLKGTLLCT